MPFERRRWLILAAGLLANMLQGAAYTVSVFRGPMSERLAAQNPDLDGDGLKFAIAVAVSLSFAFLPVGMLLAGRLADGGRGRWAVAMGAALFGSGLFLAGEAAAPWSLWLTYGVMTSLGSGMAYGTVVGAMVRWFPDRRGLAAGLAVSALGFGGVVIAPVATWLLNGWDVVVMFRALGVASFALMAFAAWFVENPPAGWTPPGWTPPAGAAGAASGGSEGVNWRGMLKSPRFYGLWALYFCGAFAGLFLIPLCKEVVWQQSAPETLALTAVMLLALMNSAGRLFWGWVSDRVGRWRAMGGLMASMIVGLAAVALCSTPEEAPPVADDTETLRLEAPLGDRAPLRVVRDLATQAADDGWMPHPMHPASEIILDDAPGLSVVFVRDTRAVPVPYRAMLLMGAIMLAGLCFGGVLGLFPSLCAEAFGTANAAVNYGVLFTAFSAAALAAPQITNAFGYTRGLAIGMGLAVVGLVLLPLLSRRPRG